MSGPGPPEEARRQHLHAQAVVEQAVVEQAKEFLMARFGCGPEMAFELLREASQDASVMVHVVAERLIEQRWGNDHETLG